MEKNFIKTNEEGKKTVFSADEITEKEPLGEGYFGSVYTVEIEKGGHKKQFAVKDYSRRGREKEFTEIAYANYLKARNAKLKVFPTVRISEDKTKLMMTLVTNEYFIVSKDSFTKWEKVNELQNMDVLISDIIKNIQIANKANISLHEDAYFFIVNKKNPEEIDFVIGDYDFHNTYEDSHKSLIEWNINEANRAIKAFLSNYVEKNKIDFYQEKYYIKIEDFLNLETKSS